MIPGADSHPQPKWYLDHFSRFCRTHDRDRQTDHTTPSVTVGLIYVRSAAMQPDSTGSNTCVSVYDAVFMPQLLEKFIWFIWSIAESVVADLQTKPTELGCRLLLSTPTLAIWSEDLERSSLWRYVCSLAHCLWTAFEDWTFSPLLQRCLTVIFSTHIVVLEMDFLFRPLNISPDDDDDDDDADLFLLLSPKDLFYYPTEHGSWIDLGTAVGCAQVRGNVWEFPGAWRVLPWMVDCHCSCCAVHWRKLWVGSSGYCIACVSQMSEVTFCFVAVCGQVRWTTWTNPTPSTLPYVCVDITPRQIKKRGSHFSCTWNVYCSNRSHECAVLLSPIICMLWIKEDDRYPFNGLFSRATWIN